MPRQSSRQANKRGEPVMKLEKLRHHVLEGMRSFVNDPPGSNFQEGYLNALEQTLQFIDGVGVPCRVVYGGNNRGRAGLSKAEIDKLCVGYYERGSVDLSKPPYHGSKRTHETTVIELRKHLRDQVRRHEHDLPDSDFIYGYLAALQEMRRVLNNVPSWRLNFKISAQPNTQPSRGTISVRV
jgi:hypothetical protein